MIGTVSIYGSTGSLLLQNLMLAFYPRCVIGVERPGPNDSSIVCISTMQPNPLLLAKANCLFSPVPLTAQYALMVPFSLDEPA